MDTKFKLEELADHDLYHLGSGEGALILAVHRKDLATRHVSRDQCREDLKTEAFKARKLRWSEARTRLDKITSIIESNGQLEINLENCDRSLRSRVHHLKSGIHDLKHVQAIEGRVTRVVPVENVTLEIVGSNFF